MKTKLLSICFVFVLIFSGSAIAQEKKVVAVADVELGNPTSRLVYKKEAVRDVITQSLYREQAFKVIDWARLSAVLFRRNLEWSDVADDAEKLEEVQEILFNDYFLTGTVSNFSERVDYDKGAFSKKKTQVASIQLDLFIKDAITNEVVAAARSNSEKKQEIKQSLGFGAGAGANLGLAQEVLNQAAELAVKDLISQLN